MAPDANWKGVVRYLLLLSLLSVVRGGLAPVFSWERLSVYLHTANRTGPFNQTALEIAAKYPLVTLEKWHQV